MAENKGVLVHCEINDGKLASIAKELLSAGSHLAFTLGQDLSAVIISNNVSGLAEEAIAYGADKVYSVDEPSLKDYFTEPYLMVMEEVIHQAQPSIILLGQTSVGRDLTPWLAFRLNTAATMDCLALEIDSETKRLLMTRPVYGGNAIAVQVSETDPQIATVRSKAMALLPKNDNRKGQIVKVPVKIDRSAIRTEVLERKIEASAGVRLEEARVVVAGGRGIGSAEGFKQLAELAGILKGAVGATRPPCDKKWIADTHQIGLTGRIVSPDLYIAVALSGASQHLSGFSSSRVIVAINKDPEANIFKFAHYGIVADWKTVLPSLTSKIKTLL